MSITIHGPRFFSCDENFENLLSWQLANIQTVLLTIVTIAFLELMFSVVNFESGQFLNKHYCVPVQW